MEKRFLMFRTFSVQWGSVGRKFAQMYASRTERAAKRTTIIRSQLTMYHANFCPSPSWLWGCFVNVCSRGQNLQPCPGNKTQLPRSFPRPGRHRISLYGLCGVISVTAMCTLTTKKFRLNTKTGISWSWWRNLSNKRIIFWTQRGSTYRRWGLPLSHCSRQFWLLNLGCAAWWWNSLNPTNKKQWNLRIIETETDKNSGKRTARWPAIGQNLCSSGKCFLCFGLWCRFTFWESKKAKILNPSGVCLPSQTALEIWTKSSAFSCHDDNDASRRLMLLSVLAQYMHKTQSLKEHRITILQRETSLFHVQEQRNAFSKAELCKIAEIAKRAWKKRQRHWISGNNSQDEERQKSTQAEYRSAINMGKACSIGVLSHLFVTLHISILTWA